MEIEDLPFIAELAPADRAQALARFDVVEAEADTFLIRRGEADDSMVIVLDGVLRVSVGELELGRVRGGQSVGELGLFAVGVRSADVQALTPARLLLLDRTDYQALVEAGNPVVRALEVLALEEVVEWLTESTERLANLARGTPLEDATPGKDFRERLRAALGSGGRRADPKVPGLAFMRRHKFLGDAPDEAILEVTSLLEPQAYDGGTFICTQGALETDMFLLVQGKVQVLVSTGDDLVEPLVVMGPGDAFGMNALLLDASRSASCISDGPVEVLRMSRTNWQVLRDKNSPGGSAMRVAMIVRVAEQLARVNGKLAELEGDLRERLDEALKGLQGAQALLESSPSLGSA